MTGPHDDRATAPRLPAPRESTLPRWLVLSLPGLLLLGLAVRTLGPVHDPDTFWHIRSGHELSRTWVFVGPDPWGTFATGTWIRHQWLVDLAFGWAESVGGLPMVATLLPVMATAVAAAIYAGARRGAGILVATLVTAVAVLAMSGSLSLRPQVVSFGFITITAAAWLATDRDGEVRWWLVPLTWVWASCHGFWFLGPALGAVAVTASMLLLRHRPPRRAIVTRWLVVLASVVAAAATPVGPRLLTAPFQVSGVTAYIEEWQRAPVTQPAFIAGAVLVGVAVVARRRTSPRADPVGWAFLLVALILVLWSRRTVGVGAAVAAPVAAAALQSALHLARERCTRAEVVVTCAAGIAGLVAATALAGGVAARPAGFPEAYASRLAAQPAGTVVCNDYFVGSWLLWRTPDLRPVMDGRTELYSPTAVRGLLDFTAAGPSWSEYADRHDCRLALVRAGSPIDHALMASTAWRRVPGDDRSWVLFERSPSTDAQVPATTRGSKA